MNIFSKSIANSINPIELSIVSPHNTATIVLLLATLTAARLTGQQGCRLVVVVVVTVTVHDAAISRLRMLVAFLGLLCLLVGVLVVLLLLYCSDCDGCCTLSGLLLILFLIRIRIRIKAITVVAAAAVVAAVTAGAATVTVNVTVITGAQNGCGHTVDLRGNDCVYVIVGFALLLAAPVRGEARRHAAQQALLHVDGREVAAGKGSSMDALCVDATEGLDEVSVCE